MSWEMQDLWEGMKAAGDSQKPHPIQFAHVATYDGKGSVTVYFPHDTSVVHGPYKLMGMGGGNGWGLQFGPLGGGLDGNGTPQGEQCLVLFPDPAGQIGFCILAAWDNVNIAPAVPGGELWGVHKNGQTIKLTNDGNAQITGAAVYLGAAGLGAGSAAIRKSDLDAISAQINTAIGVFNAHVHTNGHLGLPTGGPTSSQTATSTTASSVVFAE